MAIEIVKELDVIKPGRPLSGRVGEIADALKEAFEQDAFGLRIDLLPDEQEAFHRFAQRARSAAKHSGLKVNVSVVPGDNTSGNVRILGEI